MKLRMLLLAVLALLVVAPAPAFAHQHVHVNGMDLTIGWAVEPAIAGEPNAPEIFVEDHDGEPVTGLKLSVEVGFGDKVFEKKLLEPAFDEPGRYEADVIPTRAGTYRFRITGTLGGKPLDKTYTSGEDTFSDVEPATPLQFPEKDPTAGDLAARAEQADAQMRAVRAAATAAGDDASTAALLAWIGIGVGVLGAILGIAGLRRRAA